MHGSLSQAVAEERPRRLGGGSRVQQRCGPVVAGPAARVARRPGGAEGRGEEAAGAEPP